jgi:hypothetical protein
LTDRTDPYRFCFRCQTTRLRAEFVPVPGSRAPVECCTLCAARIVARRREIGLLHSAVAL